VALQELVRVESGEYLAPRGLPSPAEEGTAVALAVGDAVPTLEDLLARMVVPEVGVGGGVGYPSAGGVVAGPLGPKGWVAEHGDGAGSGDQE